MRTVLADNLAQAYSLACALIWASILLIADCDIPMHSSIWIIASLTFVAEFALMLFDCPWDMQTNGGKLFLFLTTARLTSLALISIGGMLMPKFLAGRLVEEDMEKRSPPVPIVFSRELKKGEVIVAEVTLNIQMRS